MVIFRIVVGGIFVFSGFTKLMFPPEEFAELIRGYQIAPQSLIHPLAILLPWVELLSGAFFLMGLFTRVAAFLVAVQLAVFMAILSSVLARGINLEDCGCFAAIGFKETPLQALIRDAVLLALVVLFIRSKKTAFSLDSSFQETSQA
jgi:uncharacterized membrane protein YphA (DoxX/SURF4 family)